MRPTYLTIDTSLVRENLRKIKEQPPLSGVHPQLLSRPTAMVTVAL